MESKPSQTKGIGDLASVTVCYFGSGTPAAALGTRLPSRDSYGYLCQSRHAPRTTADAPDSEIRRAIIRKPGEKSGLGSARLREAVYAHFGISAAASADGRRHEPHSR
jgi:hypothetical protein